MPERRKAASISCAPGSAANTAMLMLLRSRQVEDRPAVVLLAGACLTGRVLRGVKVLCRFEHHGLEFRALPFEDCDFLADLYELLIALHGTHAVARAGERFFYQFRQLRLDCGSEKVSQRRQVRRAAADHS